MADLSLRCPDCDARLRVLAGKKAVRCPKCGSAVRVPSRDPDEDEDDRPRARRRDEEDDRPRARRRDEEDDRPRARRRDDDDDDRPRRRRDDEDDRPRRRRDEDEDERPRRRRRVGSSEPAEGPWLAAVGASGGCFLLALGMAFLIFGSAGLPAGQDGPNNKAVGLGIGLLAGLVLAPVGIIGVKNRRAMGKWGIEVEGTLGVVTGFVQASIAGLVAGFALYGLVFTLINGR